MAQIIPIKRSAFTLGPIIVVLIISAPLFFFRLGERGFRDPDEGRYAEIAREMVVSNNWIEPTLLGVDYLRKPIFFYWLTAVSFKLFGQSEFSARLVPAFFGLLGVFAVYFFTTRHFGKEKAFYSSLLLATNLFYLEISRYLVIDAVFSFFLVCIFYLAYSALEERRLTNILGFYAFLGLAFLTKGLAGVAIPAFGILVYLALTGQLRSGVIRLLSARGSFLFFAIALPWYVAISIHKPEFPRLFLFHEHLSRYLSAGFEHQEPWYFYLALLPLIFSPWVLFMEPLKTALRSKCDPKDARFYLQVIFLTSLLFYSLSRSKLATYLMPVVPLGSILLGDAWTAWIEKKDPIGKLSKPNLLVISFAALFILFSCIALVAPLFGLSFLALIPEEIRFYVFLTLVLIAVQSAALTLFVLRDDKKKLFYSWIVFLSLLSFLAAFTMESLNQNYSTKHFAEILKPKLTKTDKIFIYGQPGAFYDFPFYIKHPVTLVELEGELEINKGNKEVEGAFVTRDEWKRLVGKERMYCMIRRSDYDALGAPLKQSLKVLEQDERKLLVESLPPGAI